MGHSVTARVQAPNRIIGSHDKTPTLDLPCRPVFPAGQRTVEMVGPLLEDEAATQHVGVWD